MTALRRPLLAAVASALALTGCSASAGADREEAAPPGPPPIEQYVALGDSFTAAPFVPVTDLAGGCLRSSGNYPALVAAELDAELSDVSCVGADSRDLGRGQALPLGGAGVPPQAEAVTEATDLVTIGIGGNDGDLFGTLVQRCTRTPGQRTSSCAEAIGQAYADPGTAFGPTRRHVTAALEAVRRAAPDATVLLVGYPRLVRADRGCNAMPVRAEDRPVLVTLEEELNAALADAADAGGATFVDLHGVSEGHEICSAEPWVNGRVTQQQRALAFHPFAEGQRAVAEQVLAAVESREVGR